MMMAKPVGRNRMGDGWFGSSRGGSNYIQIRLRRSIAGTNVKVRGTVRSVPGAVPPTEGLSKEAWRLLLLFLTGNYPT